MIEMQNVVRSVIQMAEAALMPKGCPFPAHALAIYHAGVDADGLAWHPVLLDVFSQFVRTFEDQVNEIGEGHLLFFGLSGIGVVCGSKSFPEITSSKIRLCRVWLGRWKRRRAGPNDVEENVRTKAPKKLFLGSGSPLLKCAQCSLEIWPPISRSFSLFRRVMSFL